MPVKNHQFRKFNIKNGMLSRTSINPDFEAPIDTEVLTLPKEITGISSLCFEKILCTKKLSYQKV